MLETTCDLDALTEKVIGCAIEVHRTLGPGLLESIYAECLEIELKTGGLRVDRARRVSIDYKGHRVSAWLEIDLLVEDVLIVEVKAVERIHPVHLAQVITYLKLTGRRAGLLMNFNTTSLRTGLKRLDHPDLYLERRTQKKAGDQEQAGY